MDRTRWTGIGALAFVVVMLGTTWFVVSARADRPAPKAVTQASPSESARAGAARSSAPGATPAPTWGGETDAEPAAEGAPASEAAGGEGATEEEAVPGGSEAPVALEPVAVEPPASGVDGDYTEDEYRAVYEELNRRSVQLARDPDPAQTSLYFSERCACYDDYAANLTELRAEGLRGDTEPALVLAFEVLTVEDDGSFVARIIDQQQPGQSIDASGDIVQERGVGKAFESNVRVSPEDSAWKVSQIEYVSEGSPGDGDPPPVAEPPR